MFFLLLSDTDEEEAVFQRHDDHPPYLALAARDSAAARFGVLEEVMPVGTAGVPSEGSDGSQMDEANNVNDEDADFRRGQRVKKLNRMLNNKAVSTGCWG